jgi:hypothetical protein
MKCELGECVYVLFYALWGKTNINGQLKSRIWWQNRLQTFINTPAIEIKSHWDDNLTENSQK